MSHRRLARASVGTTTDSPRAVFPQSVSSEASPSTPVRRAPHSTPRTRLIHPADSPIRAYSHSASVPFDWVAARSRRSPPYGTPSGGKRRGPRKSELGTPAKKIVRKKGLVERIAAVPSEIAFECSQFPTTCRSRRRRPPRGSSAARCTSCTSACASPRSARFQTRTLAGRTCIERARASRGSTGCVTVPTSFLLIAAAVLNTLYLFTQDQDVSPQPRFRARRLPNASFTRRPRSPSARWARSPEHRSAFTVLLAVLAMLWRGAAVSIRFLLNLSPPKAPSPAPWDEERVQQLEMWTPGELQMALFGTYSPVHALLWMATTSANWMLMCCIMFGVAVQLRALTRSYEVLLKDKAIIAAEVLHEYNEKVRLDLIFQLRLVLSARVQFVYPRVNPIRKDVAVMTHQSEVVNVWEDDYEYQ
ncbi:hypothetical protein A0H81_10806 [Grifola frondosa]|uniref:Uncharacterized protein n=1 Tax=Grifola frondosa TaxID=5627 RepID=A0A1C7LYB0_GRIFR|nr:hypothetical protein A0H81_10806 [Grifola frondosa]